MHSPFSNDGEATSVNSRKHSLHYFLAIAYIILLLIMLLTGSLLYSLLYRNVQNGIKAQNRLLLRSAISRLDSSMEIVSASARQISSNRVFNSFTLGLSRDNEGFFYHGYRLQQELSGTTPFTHLLPVVASYIYMAPVDYVISPIEFSDYSFYFRHNRISSVTEAEMRDMFDRAEYWNRFLKLPGVGSATDSYLYIIPLSTGAPGFNHTDYLLCNEFDGDEIARLFSEINLYDNGMLIAYNKNNREAFKLSSGEPEVDKELLSELDFVDGSADYTDKASGLRMLVTTASSDYNGWTYYLIQPRNQSFYSINLYRSFFFTITLLTFLIGGGIAVSYIVHSRRRLRQLSNAISEREVAASSLSKKVESQKPAVIESMLRRIMEGSITTADDMEEIKSTLKLKRPGIRFMVLYSEVSPAEQLEIQDNDMPLLVQNYDILIRDAIRRYYPDSGYVYKPSDYVFATLICCPSSASPEESLEKCRSSFFAMHDELKRAYGIWICGGIGGQSDLLSYTWKSYQQARESKAVTTSESYILSCNDFSSSTDVYYYPESLAVQLSGFIASGSETQTAELFKMIVTENRQRRNLSYTQLRWLISDIRATLFKRRQLILPEELNEEKRSRLNLVDRQFEGELSLDVLKSIALELCRIIGSEKNSNELILKIQDYINQNYHDPNLGLTRISESFGISESYFSYLFKRELSQNFSSYLEALRMARAKELVSEGDIALSDMYRYLGYNNAASFRRAFKKYYGVSPREMRDSALA